MLRLREAATYFGVTKLHSDLTSILKLQRDPSKDLFQKNFPGDSPIDCFKINLVLLKELKKLGGTTGDLRDACQEKRWLLARSIMYAKQRLAFLQEFQKWRDNDEYRWRSDEVEEKIFPFAHFFHDKIEFVLNGERSTERSDFSKLGDIFHVGHIDTPYEWPFVFADAISDTQKVISILCSIADDTTEFRKKFIDDEVVSFFETKKGQNTYPFHLVVNLRTFKKGLEPCSAEEEAIFKNTADSINLNTGLHHEYATPVYYLIKPCALFPKERWEQQQDFIPGFPNPLLDDGAPRDEKCSW